MKYKWKGPATSIEIWTDSNDEPVFAGFVSAGQAIPAELDPENAQVKGWLAFGLIEINGDEAEKSPAKGKKGDADNG